MTTDRPIGSVTGQQGWDWNRSEAERRSRSVSADSSAEQSKRRDTHPETADASTLRTRLEQKEQHLQYVIEHYEQLLTEKNRQLSNQEDTESTENRLSAALSNILP